MATRKQKQSRLRGVSTSQRECTGCGAVYELSETHLPARDKDSIDCGICGTELISWNGACCYSSKLLSKGSKV